MEIRYVSWRNLVTLISLSMKIYQFNHQFLFTVFIISFEAKIANLILTNRAHLLLFVCATQGKLYRLADILLYSQGNYASVEYMYGACAPKID